MAAERAVPLLNGSTMIDRGNVVGFGNLGPVRPVEGSSSSVVTKPAFPSGGAQEKPVVVSTPIKAS